MFILWSEMTGVDVFLGFWFGLAKHATSLSVELCLPAIAKVGIYVAKKCYFQ